jgi:hypothetical protein
MIFYFGSFNRLPQILKSPTRHHPRITDMRNLNQDTITQAVIARFANTPDPRLKEIINSLVQHLHAFAREVRLTEKEWEQGIDFLTRVGQKCDDKRQEFILLSDTLGLSMLTVAMNNDKPEGCTEATVVGPFHVEGAPHYEHGDDVGNGAVGQPCLVRGTVRGLDGKAIAGATMEVWQADADGLYDVQHPDYATEWRVPLSLYLGRVLPHPARRPSGRDVDCHQPPPLASSALAFHDHRRRL